MDENPLSDIEANENGEDDVSAKSDLGGSLEDLEDIN